MSCALFRLAGLVCCGFMAAVWAVEGSSLRFQRNGASLVFEVPMEAVLESATNAQGTWTPEQLDQTAVSNGIRFCTFELNRHVQRFFRLRFIPPLGYDIGQPEVQDIFLSPAGDDGNPGTRERPLRHLSAAWARIPQTPAATGFRINFLPGQYPCEGDCINYFAHRWGSRAAPIILRAADGLGTVTLLGGLNLEDVRYLYLMDLELRAGPEASFGNNVLHIASGDHILLKNCRVRGPNDINDDNPMQEVIKANQCDYLYVEQCDLSGTHQTVLDYFAVRHGHVIDTKMHRSGGRGAYVKGGSAYLRFERNEIFDCREAGFQAGEASTFTLMQPPWIHYEAYDVKFVNNVLHDVYGAGLSVAGGYNVLMAHNTLYRIGLNDEQDRSWSLAQFIRGGRVNMVVDEYPSAPQAQARASELIALGGWGTTVVTGMDAEQHWIPNRNVLVCNNVFFNPAGTNTAYNHFLVLAPETLPTRASNVPSPSRTDDNLRIFGNVVWNGAGLNLELVGSYSGETGCADGNTLCNPAQLARDNYINAFEPVFRNAAQGDFRPVQGSTLAMTGASTIPDFTWADAPQKPVVPAGDLSNTVTRDARGLSRSGTSMPGALLP